MDKLKVEMDKLSKVETYSIVLGSLLLALVLFLAGLFLRSRRSQTGSVILLVGPSDGGKTAIFSSLIYNHAPQTHTSLQPNTAMYKPPSPFHRHPLQLVDIPGHPRIRGQFVDYLLGKSSSSNISTKGVKGIVFVCDGAALTRNASNVAEHLVLVMKSLASLPPSQSTPPLLIWANKSDLLPSPPSSGAKVPNTQLALNRTMTILERELEKRRLSSLKSGAALNDLGGGDSEEVGLDGVLDVSDGGEFKFEKWDGEVAIKAGWVDVKKKGKATPLGESDDESEVENEKKTEGGEEKESEKRKADGLAELVDWIAGLP